MGSSDIMMLAGIAGVAVIAYMFKDQILGALGSGGSGLTQQEIDELKNNANKPAPERQLSPRTIAIDYQADRVSDTLRDIATYTGIYSKESGFKDYLINRHVRELESIAGMNNWKAQKIDDANTSALYEYYKLVLAVITELKIKVPDDKLKALYRIVYGRTTPPAQSSYALSNLALNESMSVTVL